MNNFNSNDAGSTLTKFTDIYNIPGVDITVGSNAQFILLNGIISGTDFYNRTNRIVLAKCLEINFNFFECQTAFTGYYASDIARVLVVWDHQAETSPNISNFLLDVTASGTTSTTNLSHKNINNKERFIFLFDKRYALPAYSVTTVNQIGSINSAYNGNWSHTININLDSLVTRFKSTGTGISAFSTGGLYLIILGGNLLPSWAMNFSARYSFLDC